MCICPFITAIDNKLIFAIRLVKLSISVVHQMFFRLACVVWSNPKWFTTCKYASGARKYIRRTVLKEGSAWKLRLVDKPTALNVQFEP